jgi:glucuronokinase
LKNLYIAYDPNRAEESGKAHKKVKQRFQNNDRDVIGAMSEFADIAQKGRDALVSGRFDEIAGLINANFDLRDKIFNVAEENRRMVMAAREVGASAKFAGSGGTIVGTYGDEAQYKMLVEKLALIGCRTLKPVIASNEDETAQIVSQDGWRNS